MDFEQDNSKLDDAVARRLRRLGTMPVDTHNLESRLREQIAIPRLGGRWLRPMRAVAASFGVLLLAGAIIWSTSGGAVLASPSQMAQMHNELVSGKTTVMQVDSIEAANKALSSQWPQSPGVPSVPSEHVMACCMKSVKNKKVACVLLKNGGIPVTLTVANAADMCLPTSPTIQRGGITYHVQTEGALKMVMTERNDRWICLIGELSADKLIDLATKLGF